MKNMTKAMGSILCALLAGLSCTASPLAIPPYGPVAEAAMWKSTVVIMDDLVPLAGGTKVLAPQTGSVTYSGGSAVIDASNTSEGYIMVKYTGGNSRIKVLVTRGGGTTYQYNLNTNGAYEVLPLSSGSGSYKVGVYRNVSGDQYAEVLVKNIDVNLRSETLPFLYPSQYVNFNANSKAVAKAQELAANSSSDLEIVSAVYNYVISNISYDTYKAQTVQRGYLPVVDTILDIKKGICFDYAALMTAMLRSQQIPTRLEIGYVSNGAYHAWLSTYIADVGWVNGIIQFDGVSWKLMDPTFASSGGSSSNIMQYIGNGSNYRIQYMY